MSQGKVIRISSSVFSRLQDIAEPFTDTPATVIERLLDYYENNNVTHGSKISEHSCANIPVIRQLDPLQPPDLKHTKIKSATLGDSNVERKLCKWNLVASEILSIAMKQAKSFDALQLITGLHIKPGRYEKQGFKYISKVDISLQYVDSNKAWIEILEVAKKLNIPVRLHIKWLDKEDAAFPNEEALLIWSP